MGVERSGSGFCPIGAVLLDSLAALPRTDMVG